jgi:hypothetical protein
MLVLTATARIIVSVHSTPVPAECGAHIQDNIVWFYIKKKRR